jgi:hypothetical protein
MCCRCRAFPLVELLDRGDDSIDLPRNKLLHARHRPPTMQRLWFRAFGAAAIDSL